MATVWAFNVGNFAAKPSTGWSHTIRFRTLTDLTRSMGEAGLRGKVTKLGIVAHGDSEGLVKLDKDLTPFTMPMFHAEVTTLNEYLAPSGRLIFFSCISAVGRAGDLLLTGLSKWISPRFVIGFVVQGATGHHALKADPGQIYEILGGGGIRGQGSGMPAHMLNRKAPLDEESIHAKWAQNGRIVRLPAEDVQRKAGLKPPYRCAWDACPGHQRFTDRCTPHVP